jgi:hypothetical protein
MRLFLASALLIVLSLMLTGCGNDGLLRTQGKLLKGGEPFIPDEVDDEALQVTFVPILPDGKPPSSYYFAAVNQETGTFVPSGAMGKGMPPGKYRVAVELMRKKKDLLKGKFGLENSPFIFEVDANTSEIVIDLDEFAAK